MNYGVLEGLISGAEQVVFDREVTGSAVSSISTGNILNGDEDGWYTIIVRQISGNNSGSIPYLRFNNDTGTNYGYRDINVTNTTIANANAASQDKIYLGTTGANVGDTHFSIARLYAKSGSFRTVHGVLIGNIVTTTVNSLDTIAQVWSNTTDNIVSMEFLSSANSFNIGTRITVIKCNNFTSVTPAGIITTPYIKGAWVRLPGGGTLGSATNSVNFTGLDGDRDVLYYLSASYKASGTIQAGIQFNSDSGTNYGLQQLEVHSSTIVASRSAYDRFYFPIYTTPTNGQYTRASMLLFAKQGFLRPAITEAVCGVAGKAITSLNIQGQSYSVTNTNITSMNVFTANNFDTGSQFDLYALRPNG